MIDIERFMSSMKITQSDLATKLGVSQTAISLVKNGRMDFPQSWISIIEQEYKVDISNFISPDIVSEPPEPYEPANNRAIDTVAEANKILATANKQLAEVNARMQDQMLRINEKLLQIIDKKELV